jgi:hypothetical protein
VHLHWHAFIIMMSVVAKLEKLKPSPRVSGQLRQTGPTEAGSEVHCHCEAYHDSEQVCDGHPQADQHQEVQGHGCGDSVSDVCKLELESVTESS